MQENEQENADSTNDTEKTENETEAVVESGSVEETDAEAEARAEQETIAELQKKLSTAEIQKNKWRDKAEKAKETVKAESKSALSYKDTIALTNAKVHEDDIDEVLDYAKFKNISIAEALKTNVLKASLADNVEKRDTAEATNTGKSRGGSASRTGDSLLSKARQKGEMPDSDEDLDKLLEARFKKS